MNKVNTWVAPLLVVTLSMACSDDKEKFSETKPSTSETSDTTSASTTSAPNTSSGTSSLATDALSTNRDVTSREPGPRPSTSDTDTDGGVPGRNWGDTEDTVEDTVEDERPTFGRRDGGSRFPSQRDVGTRPGRPSRGDAGRPIFERGDAGGLPGGGFGGFGGGR